MSSTGEPYIISLIYGKYHCTPHIQMINLKGFEVIKKLTDESLKVNCYERGLTEDVFIYNKIKKLKLDASTNSKYSKSDRIYIDNLGLNVITNKKFFPLYSSGTHINLHIAEIYDQLKSYRNAILQIILNDLCKNGRVKFKYTKIPKEEYLFLYKNRKILNILNIGGKCLSGCSDIVNKFINIYKD